MKSARGTREPLGSVSQQIRTRLLHEARWASRGWYSCRGGRLGVVDVGAAELLQLELGEAKFAPGHFLLCLLRSREEAQGQTVGSCPR